MPSIPAQCMGGNVRLNPITKSQKCQRPLLRIVVPPLRRVVAGSAAAGTHRRPRSDDDAAADATGSSVFSKNTTSATRRDEDVRPTELGNIRARPWSARAVRLLVPAEIFADLVGVRGCSHRTIGETSKEPETPVAATGAR